MNNDLNVIESLLEVCDSFTVERNTTTTYEGDEIFADTYTLTVTTQGEESVFEIDKKELTILQIREAFPTVSQE